MITTVIVVVEKIVYCFEHIFLYITIIPVVDNFGQTKNPDQGRDYFCVLRHYYTVVPFSSESFLMGTDLGLGE